MRKKILFLGIICFISAMLHQATAVSAYPYPVEVTQPDGTTLTIRLHGDERFRYVTTADGYMIVRNQQDFYVYATVSQTGEMQATPRIARNANERTAGDASFLRSLDTSSDISRLRNAASKRQMPKKETLRATQTPPKQKLPAAGTPSYLVILVSFKDLAFKHSKGDFENLLNQQGYSANGATGSVRDYYMASSYGKFTPAFDVVGPYTLPQNMNYYGANDADDLDIRPAEMIVHACSLAYNAGVNFAKYDLNGDGWVDNVYVVYAGHNEAEGAPANTIWPHRWGVFPNSAYGEYGNYDGMITDVLFGDYDNFVLVCDYACSSELKGKDGNNMCAIGTFCHEFAHTLGLPDYYHTTDSRNKQALETWSLMDLGNYNNESRTPPVFSAYDRFFMGWLTPEKYTGGIKTLYPLAQVTSPPANTNGQAYLFSTGSHNLNGKTPSPNEFFIAEYRARTGWDTYLGEDKGGESGMLIWHIDYNATAWNMNEVNNYTGATQTQASHMRVYLEPTDGLSQTSPGGAFTSGTFIPKLWNGTDINLPIANIVKNGSTSMTFGVIAPQPATNFAATVKDGNKVVLTWTPSVSTTVTSYKIYRNNILQYTISGRTSNTYTQFNVPNGTHAYSIATSDGVVESAKANASANVTLSTAACPHSQVYNLKADASVNNKVQLTWDAPTAGPRWESIYSLDGDVVNADVVGMVEFKFTATVGRKWSKSELSSMNGFKISKVKFIPWHEPPTHKADYRVEIYSITGGNSKLEYYQAIPTVTSGQLNEIKLNTPVVIDASKEWIVGIRYVPTGTVGAIFITDKQTSGDLRNVVYFDDDMGWVSFTTANPAMKGNYCLDVYFEGESPSQFAVYRDGKILNAAVTGRTYADTTVDPFTTYSYCVAAKYSSCDSEPFCVETKSMESTGFETPLRESAFVYCKDHIIYAVSTASDPIRRIEIYNTQGKQIYLNDKVNAATYTIYNNVSLPEICIVRVITEKRVINVKILK